MLSDFDIMILVYIDMNDLSNVYEISRNFGIDKTQIYKSIRKLKEKDIVVSNKVIPMQYSIDTNEFNKWIESQ
jgi:predicted transcriptional regulator